MKKLLRLLGSFVAYFSIATIISQGIIVVVFVQRTQLTRDKWSRMLAAAYGLDLPAGPAKKSSEEAITTAQPSYDQMLAVRAVGTRNLELREQALRGGLDQLRNEQRRLVEENKRFSQIRSDFEIQLRELSQGATATGLEDVRRTLETIKPKQAKIQILKMLADEQLDEVVMLLTNMPDNKRAKIVAEFKTPEEENQLAEILERIRKGVPVVEPVDKTREQLAQPQPIKP